MYNSLPLLPPHLSLTRSLDHSTPFPSAPTTFPPPSVTLFFRRSQCSLNLLSCFLSILEKCQTFLRKRFSYGYLQ